MAEDNLPVWSNRFKDNYYKGLVANLEAMIDECEDYSTLMKIGTTLKNGLGGRAINKARELDKVNQIEGENTSQDQLLAKQPTDERG